MRCTPIALSSLMLACFGAAADVFPTSAHTNNNTVPFGSDQSTTMHQVFASSLFSNATGGLPAVISSIAFAPTVNGTYSADVTIRLGYTDRTPGVAPPAGLELPTVGSPGEPNAAGPMTLFFADPLYSTFITGAVNSNFQMSFAGTPFTYDPALGNLLVEVVTVVPAGLNLSVSRTSGGPESSRAYNGTGFTGVFPTTALRMDIVFTIGGGTGCYANCDGSTTSPVLNVADFTCFLSRFAAGESYANCDQSTTAPVLNVADFTCFLQSFAGGCP